MDPASAFFYGTGAAGRHRKLR